MFVPAPTLRVTLRRVRALSKPLAIGLLALCVALASGFGGITFTQCLGTGRVHLTTCCSAAMRAAAAAAHETGIDAVSRPVRVCCEGHRVDSLPRTQNALSNHLGVMPAAILATLSLEEMFDRGGAPAETHARCSQHAVRAGPESPLFELNSAYLI
jgi:hypothetical protein